MMTNYRDIKVNKRPKQKKGLLQLFKMKPIHLSMSLFLAHNLVWAGVLPLEFIAVPSISNMALGQQPTLSYTIRNQVQNRNLPLRSIRVANAGDQQANILASIETTCGAFLAPNATCTITVRLENLKAGAVRRFLSIDYNGRGPLISPISFDVSPADYTVLIYMVGSDLESKHNQGTFNIGQMMQVGSSSKMNIVLETGGANKPGWRTVQRKIVYPGRVSLIKDLDFLDMSATNVIQDFVLWGITNYPARKYALIYWDHGGGPNGGFGGDELNQNRSTPINQLSLVSQNVYNLTGTRFEFIGFDACFLGNAETYAGLYPYANYLIGSEDIEPGKGWQYNTFLGYMQQNPKASGLDIGINIVDGFTDQNSKGSTTLSVVDSAAMPSVLAAINAFATALQPYAASTTTDWLNIARNRLKAPDYATSVWDKKSRDLVDIIEFIQLIQTQFSFDTTLYFASADLVAAVKNAVKYFKNSSNRQASQGLTFYFPSIMSEYVTTYPQTTVLNGTQFFSQSYMNLVTSYYDFYDNNSNVLEASTSNMTHIGNTYSATVNGYYDQAFAAIGNEACTNVYSGTQVVTTPCYTSMQLLPSSSSAPTSQIQFIENNAWPLINNTTPVFLIPDVYPNFPNEANYLIPVVRSSDGDVGYLFVILNSDAEFVITGFQEVTGSSNTQSKLEEISADEEFYLRTYAQDPNDNNDWALLRTDIVITSPFTLSFGPIPSTLPPNMSTFNAFRFLVADLTGSLAISSSATYP